MMDLLLDNIFFSDNFIYSENIILAIENWKGESLDLEMSFLTN